jgi:hypothetical protein
MDKGYVAMDKGYDNSRVYAECEERGGEPIIPLRGAKANQPALPLALGGGCSRAPRATLSGGGTCTVAARPLSGSSDTWSTTTDSPRFASVAWARPASRRLTMLARLAQALSRARTVALAAWNSGYGQMVEPPDQPEEPQLQLSVDAERAAGVWALGQGLG